MYVQSEPACDFAKYNHQKLYVLTCTLSLSFSPFVSLSLSLCFVSFVCLFCLFVCLCVCPCVRPSVRLSVYLCQEPQWTNHEACSVLAWPIQA